MDLSMPKADIIKVPTVHRLDLAQIIASYPSEWRALDNGCLLERIQLLLKRVVDLYNTRINHKPRYYRFKELSMNQRNRSGGRNPSPSPRACPSPKNRCFHWTNNH